MFRRHRLKKVHAAYLEASRNLKEGRDYWRRETNWVRGFLEFISPVPLIGLYDEGARLLAALTWLEDSCEKVPLSTEILRTYHRLIYPAGEPSVGVYRKGQASVLESKIARPHHQKVQALTMQLDRKLRQEQETLDRGRPAEPDDVLRLAIQVHQKIAFIHPFTDGNGRVARLAMNHILRRYGLGYAILPPLNESPRHFQALEEAHLGNPQLLFDLTRSCLRSL